MKAAQASRSAATGGRRIRRSVSRVMVIGEAYAILWVGENHNRTLQDVEWRFPVCGVKYHIWLINPW